MMLHAWNGYKNYSWGENELRPVSKTFHTQGIFGGREMPATIVDAADTLWIMGLKKEYTQARDYIRDNFDMSKATGSLSVFETNIRFLGGLLSLYALTGEEFYIDKARSVGEALLPAFKTPTGLAKSNLNVQSKSAFNYGWANGGSSVLAEFGSLHLEFVYLSRIAKAPIFEKKVKKIRDLMDRVEKVDGLYSNYIDSDTGKWTQPYHMYVILLMTR
ncbi:glycosyl hydrolase family 47 [Oesophagostomum dentatum]|uniref:alpha-1,2-Mannosidase n=1 Tax=Oesophagostomum dentatum TaxID=61180 RepID=A0A0B1TQM7_OESDE|nr:glycosyl hydrolase family 47 [Oesophagostomum dentatum]